MRTASVFLLAVFWGAIVAMGAQAAPKQPDKPTYTIVVVFSDFTVHVYDSDGIELFFSAVSLPRKTPKLPVRGRLIRIERNPWWYPPPGVKKYVLETQKIELPDEVPPGPNNPMGPVKFTFEFFTPGAEKLSKMHGTNHPESIGRKATSGCIRLYNEEVLAVADIVEPLLNSGAEVLILYTKFFDGTDNEIVSR